MMLLRTLAAVVLTWAVVPANAAELPFKVLSTGKVNGQVASGLTEARDKQALQRIWSSMKLKGTPPKVNFKQRMAVAWVGGGSACDKFVLTHVRESDTEVVLEIDHVRPPPGNMCIMIFSPSHIVASIPVTTKPIRSNLPGSSNAAASR